MKKLLLAICVLFGIGAVVISFKNLGDVGVWNSSYWPWQQPVFFTYMPSGSVPVSGTISNGGLSWYNNTYTFTFQTSQANGISWVYYGTVSTANFTGTSIGNPPQTYWTGWNFDINVDKGFTHGDGIYLTIYNSAGSVVATTGGTSSATLIVSP